MAKHLAQKSRHELLSECQTNRASVAVFSPGQHESILKSTASAVTPAAQKQAAITEAAIDCFMVLHNFYWWSFLMDLRYFTYSAAPPSR